MIDRHTCDPSQWCGLCDQNVKAGGRRNHPGAPKRPVGASPYTTTTTCPHMDPTPKRIGLRVWNQCLGGYGSTFPDERAGHVCGCATASPGLWRKGHECGPACPGFPTPLPSRIETATWVPTTDPIPAAPRFVVTVAVGEEGKRTLDLTAPSQRRYAERVGAEYVALTSPTQSWFMLEKFRYRPFVAAAPTLCIDADVWVGDDAPDLFAFVPDGHVGASIASDLGPHGLLPEFARKLHDVCRSQGVPVPPAAEGTHWNSGLVLLRPGQEAYWDPPRHPLPKHWIAEELWSKVSVTNRGWPVFDLPHPTVHWQWWRDRDSRLLGDPRHKFVHPAGLTQQPDGLRKRLDLFRRLETERSDRCPT